MNVEMVWNELSLGSPAADEATGLRWMDSFATTLAAASRYGAQRVLRTQRGFSEILIAPGYPIGRWGTDKRVNADARRIFLQWTTKSPYLEGILDESLDDFVGRSEFRFNGRICVGLAMANLVGGLAISFPSHADWDSDYVDVDTLEMVEEEEEQWKEYILRIRHASNSKHVAAHREWLGSRLKAAVRGGSDCCERSGSLFPHLILCDNVKKQLSGLSPTDALFKIGLESLFQLEEYCALWRTGGFTKESLSGCAPETQATLNEFSEERTFLCPDGVERVFSWHLKRGKKRVHFHPDGAMRTIIVGYIGKHLRTVRYH